MTNKPDDLACILPNVECIFLCIHPNILSAIHIFFNEIIQLFFEFKSL